jgi:hypothetical protein
MPARISPLAVGPVSHWILAMILLLSFNQMTLTTISAPLSIASGFVSHWIGYGFGFLLASMMVELFLCIIRESGVRQDYHRFSYYREPLVATCEQWRRCAMRRQFTAFLYLPRTDSPPRKNSKGSIQNKMRLLFLTFGVVPEHLVPIIPSIRRHSWGFFQLDAGSRLQWNLAPEL